MTKTLKQILADNKQRKLDAQKVQESHERLERIEWAKFGASMVRDRDSATTSCPWQQSAKDNGRPAEKLLTGNLPRKDRGDRSGR